MRLHPRLFVVALLMGVSGLTVPAFGQHLRFRTGHREIQVPDYATLRIGPFYSDIEFRQSIGYRYSETSQDVLDLVVGTDRGVMNDSGHEFPIASTLSFKNYLPISRGLDLDSSFWIRYSHYPLGTQEDDFSVNFADEGISGDISFQILPSDWVKVMVYIRPSYMTDFVDLSGISDAFGGRKYSRFDNKMGVNMDWLINKDFNLATTIARDDTIPDSGEFDKQKRTTYRGSVAFEWQVDPLMVAGVRSDVTLSGYESDERDDYRQNTYSVFANADVTRNSTVGANIGYSTASAESSVDMLSGSLRLNTDLAKDLSQSVYYIRSQSQGFTHGIDSTTAYGYRLNLDGDLVGVALDSSLTSADTTGGKVSGYSTWQNKLTFSYPVKDLMVIRYITSYSTKTHGDITAPEDEDVDVEFKGDYDTWLNTIEATLPLARNMNVSGYVTAVTRDADVSSLEYDWFMLGLNLEYVWSID